MYYALTLSEKWRTAEMTHQGDGERDGPLHLMGAAWWWDAPRRWGLSHTHKWCGTSIPCPKSSCSGFQCSSHIASPLLDVWVFRKGGNSLSLYLPLWWEVKVLDLRSMSIALPVASSASSTQNILEPKIGGISLGNRRRGLCSLRQKRGLWNQHHNGTKKPWHHLHPFCCLYFFAFSPSSAIGNTNCFPTGFFLVNSLLANSSSSLASYGRVKSLCQSMQ